MLKQRAVVAAALGAIPREKNAVRPREPEMAGVAIANAPG